MVERNSKVGWTFVMEWNGVVDYIGVIVDWFNMDCFIVVVWISMVNWFSVVECTSMVN